MSIRFSDFGRKINNDKIRRSIRSTVEDIRPTGIRESFYNGAYDIGAIVESNSNLYEIVDVRSNYLVLIDESGSISKKFPRDITSTNEHSLEYENNTFKGIPISHETIIRLVEDYESGIISDVFSVIKCAKWFNDNQIGNLNEALMNMGYTIMENKEQIAVLQLMAGAIGTNGKTSEELKANIESRFKTMKMSDNQKKIFMDMNKIAAKNGIKLKINEDEYISDIHPKRRKGILGKTGTQMDVILTDIHPDAEESEHDTIGASLGADNDTARRMRIRRLKGLD